MRTDGRTDMTKLKVAFRNFANAPKICIHEEIQRRLKSGSTCHHSLQILLSSNLLSRNIQKIFRTVILPIVSYGSEIWSLTLGEYHRSEGVREYYAERDIWPKRNVVTGEWRGLHNEDLDDLYC